MSKLLSNIRSKKELQDIIENLGLRLPETLTESTLRNAIASHYGEFQNNLDIDSTSGLLIVRNHKTGGVLTEKKETMTPSRGRAESPPIKHPGEELSMGGEAGSAAKERQGRYREVLETHKRRIAKEEAGSAAKRPSSAISASEIKIHRPLEEETTPEPKLPGLIRKRLDVGKESKTGEELAEPAKQPRERKRKVVKEPEFEATHTMQGVTVPVRPTEATDAELLENPNKALTSGKVRQRTTKVLLDKIYETNDPALKNELETHLQGSKGDKTFKEKPGSKEDPMFRRKEKVKSVLTRDPMIARRKFLMKGK